MTDLDQHHYQMVFRNSLGERRRACRNTAEGSIAFIDSMSHDGWAAQVFTIPRYECSFCATAMGQKVVHRDWLGWAIIDGRLATPPWINTQFPQQAKEYRCSRCQVLWITRPGEAILVQDGQPVCPNCLKAQPKAETRIGHHHADERGVYDKQTRAHLHICTCGHGPWGMCYRADCDGENSTRPCPWHDHTYTDRPDVGRDMILAAFGE